MFECILVPLKGDATDQAVIDQAGALARLSGGKLVLLHVVHAHTLDEAAFRKQEASVHLEEKVALLAADGIPAESRVVEGEPAAAVVAVAAEVPADLIVMATHGHTEVRHVFMGSVTEDVVRSAPAPVLLVRP